MNTSYVNRRLFHSTGQKVGTITDVIHEPHTLEPEWVIVRIGLFRREYLVPVSFVETVAGRLVTSLDRTLITSTPPIHDHFRPTPGQQASVLRDYGLTEADLVSSDASTSSASTSSASIMSPPAATPPTATPSMGSEGFAFAGMETDPEVAVPGASGFVVVLDEAVGATLVRTLGDASGNGPAMVHLIVPVNPVDSDTEAYGRVESDAPVRDVGSTVAEWHLSAAIRQLSALGFAADGIVAGEDPVAEVVQMVADDPGVDGVIVSTRSDTASRWLGRDLPSRISRACPVPVVAVIVDDPPLAA